MMAEHYKEKLIGGLTCRTNQFTGSTGFKLLVELIQLLGPSLLPMLGASKSLKGILDMDVSDLRGSLSELLLKLDPDKNLNLILRLLAQTEIEGSEITAESFNLIFQGKMLLMFQTVIFAVEVNYKDFLGDGGFQGLIPKKTPPKKNTTRT